MKENVGDHSENSNGLSHMDQITESQFDTPGNDSTELPEELLATEDDTTKATEENFSPLVENSVESELDADEENVDNQIIEISGGTGNGLVSDSVNTNDVKCEVECDIKTEEMEELMETSVDVEPQAAESTDLENVKTDVQDFILATIDTAVKSGDECDESQLLLIKEVSIFMQK